MKQLGARGQIAVAAAGFGLALALRALFLASARENYDFASWRNVVEVLQRGGSLYQGTIRYNYSPLWAGVLLGLDGLGRVLGVSFFRLVSLFLLVVDVVTAALIRSIALQRGSTQPQALLASLLFFANPISVIVSSYLAAFDNLSVLFLLLALYYAGRSPAAKGEVAGSLAVSLLAKHVTWFHPLLFARRRQGTRLSWVTVLCPYAIFLASFAPFWRQREGIRSHVFGYQGLDEPYGTEPLRFVSWLPRGTTTALFGLAALAAVLLLRRVELGQACLMLFLVLLIFTPGICPYYFVWPVALGALFSSAGFLVYTVVVAAFFVHSPDVIGLELPHLPGWSGPWWALVLWLLLEIRSRTRDPARAITSRVSGTS